MQRVDFSADTFDDVLKSNDRVENSTNEGSLHTKTGERPASRRDWNCRQANRYGRKYDNRRDYNQPQYGNRYDDTTPRPYYKNYDNKLQGYHNNKSSNDLRRNCTRFSGEVNEQSRGRPRYTRQEESIGRPYGQNKYKYVAVASPNRSERRQRSYNRPERPTREELTIEVTATHHTDRKEVPIKDKSATPKNETEKPGEKKIANNSLLRLNAKKATPPKKTKVKAKNVTSGEERRTEPPLNSKTVKDPDTSTSQEPSKGVEATTTPGETIDNQPETVTDTTEQKLKLPRISIIPLSRLLRDEHIYIPEYSQGQKIAENIAATTPATINTTQKCSGTASVLQRRREVSTSSNSSSTATADPLVEKLASMDKSGIKNVINSSGTKYDEALKMQARKRLRDEIRKQLMSMQAEVPKDATKSEFVPDEIVDALDIPEVVLDEIRRAFGIEIFARNQEHANVANIATTANDLTAATSTCTNEVNTAEVLAAEIDFVHPVSSPNSGCSKHNLFDAISGELMTTTPTSRIPSTGETMKASPKSQSTPIAETMKTTPITRITTPTAVKHTINKEEMSPSTKHSQRTDKETPARKKLRHSKTRRKKSKSSKSPRQTNEVIVIGSSSSSSSSSFSSSSSTSTSSASSSSSSSDSDTYSNKSKASSSSSLKRRLRKQRNDTENVIANFEKLILNNLSENLVKRYRTRYSSSTHNKLHFISCICASDYNSEKFSKFEIAKIQQNLKTADKTFALQFLMREIMHIAAKQRIDAKEGAGREDGNTLMSKPQMNDKEPMRATFAEGESMLEYPNRIEATSPADGGGAIKSKSVDAAEKAADCAMMPWVAELSAIQSMPPGKHQSVSQQIATTAATLAIADYAQVMRTQKDTSVGPKMEWDMKVLATKTQSPHMSGGLNPSLNFTDYMKYYSTLNGPMSLADPMMETQMFTPVDLETLKKPLQLGEAVLQSLCNIDAKLLELQERKIFIEGMMLRLQRDKNDTDIALMKLNFEKSALLNTAKAATGACAAPVTKSETISRKHRSPTTNQIKKRRVHGRKKAELSSTLEMSSGTEDVPMPPQIFKATHSQNDDKLSPKSDHVAETPVSSYDYTHTRSGSLLGVKSAITQIRVHEHLVIAAAEDGTLYSFDLETLQLERQVAKHSEAITHMYLCHSQKILYTTSLDGYFKKTAIDNLDSEKQSLYLKEPLQSIDVQWGVGYIGSRWGNIFTYNTTTNCIDDAMLCSTNASIIALKATKEGARKVLVISSKGNVVELRDATTGLLLRQLDVPEHLHIYSLLLDDDSIYCGTQRREVCKFNFATGARLTLLSCGMGAVTMRLYGERYLLVGCYDGYIYVLDKLTGQQAGRFAGSGKMVLTMEILGNKVITSAKDKTLKIIDFPSELIEGSAADSVEAK